jgi:hypothetical protein
MNKNEVLNTILGIPGAAMARQNKTNFVVIPVEDGVVKIAVGTALAADTKTHKAFNMEAAMAEYKAWEAETALKAAERANRPAKVKGPNPEAQARRDALDALINEMPAFAELTATDIMKALEGKVSFTLTPMNVGQSAKRLVNSGVLVVTTKENDKKPYYTKA